MTAKRHQNSRSRKQRITLVSIALSLSLLVGGTLAYIIQRTGNVENQFVPSYVTCQVNANEDGTIDVTNTGDINAYIRAAVLVQWMDADGNVFGIAPTENEYTLSVNTEYWEKDSETGYYYYKDLVARGGTTESLISDYELKSDVSAPAGYTLTVEMTAEAIQAEGDTDNASIPAYQDAWSISTSGGN